MDPFINQRLGEIPLKGAAAGFCCGCRINQDTLEVLGVDVLVDPGFFDCGGLGAGGQECDQEDRD